jgi:hypothetical protein
MWKVARNRCFRYKINSLHLGNHLTCKYLCNWQKRYMSDIKLLCHLWAMCVRTCSSLQRELCVGVLRFTFSWQPLMCAQLLVVLQRYFNSTETYLFVSILTVWIWQWPLLETMLCTLCCSMSYFKLSIKGMQYFNCNSANTSIWRPVAILVFSEIFVLQEARLQLFLTSSWCSIFLVIKIFM